MPCSCRSHAAARLRSRPASLTSRWARLSVPPCRGRGAGTGRPRGPLRPAPPPRLSVAGRRDAYGNGGSLRLWDGGSAQGEEGRGPRSGPVSRGVRRRRGSALPRGAGRGLRREAADAGHGGGEGEGTRASGPHSPRPSARSCSPFIDRAASFPPTVALRRGAPRRSPLRARPAVRRRPPRGSLAARWTPASRTRGGPAPRPFARRQGEARGGGGASRRRRAVSVQRTVCPRTTVVRPSSGAPREIERTPTTPP